MRVNFPKPVAQNQLQSIRPIPSTNILEPKQNVFVTKPSITPAMQIQTQAQNDERLKEEEDNFKTLVKDKLSKLDDFMINLKDKQDQLFNQKISTPIIVESQQNVQQHQPLLEKKTTRVKKTYYPISDTMWQEIKSSYTDIPDSYKSKMYSDGTSFYAELKGKKTLLDGKAYLKIINNK